MRNPAAVLVLALGALVAAGYARAAPGHRVPARAQRGLALRHLHAARATSRSPRAASSRRRSRDAPATDCPRSTELLSQLGRPEDGTDPTLPNNLEVFVKLKPLDEWRPQHPHARRPIIEMDRNLKEIPGLEYNFSPADPRQRGREHLRPVRPDRASRSTATTSTSSQELAERGRGRDRRGRPASPTSASSSRGEQPQIAVDPDRDALARYDLDLGDVQDYIETALAGHAASRAVGRREALRRHRAPAARTRETIEAIRNLRVPLKDGALVPVSALADVKHGHRPRGDHARERPALRRHPHERAQPRPRLVRRRGAAARSARAVKLPAGYDHALGRRVREPAARDEAADARDAAGAAADVPPAVLGVRHRSGTRR